MQVCERLFIVSHSITVFKTSWNLLKNSFSILVSKKIVDVPSRRGVESNAVASILFDPTVDQIEEMASELCRLKTCDSASLDAEAMVLMKLVLEVGAPWKIQKITT